MLIRLNVDKVRVVCGCGAMGLWWGVIMGPGQWGPTFLANGWAPSLIFKFWHTFNTIQVHPALNLRQGMNSVAFSTYIINFQLSNWSPSWSTLITYKVGKMGLDVMADNAGWNAFKIKLIWLIFHSLLCIVWGLFDWELGRNIYRLIWPSFMQVCGGFARKSCKSCQVGISHDRLFLWPIPPLSIDR